MRTEGRHPIFPLFFFLAACLIANFVGSEGLLRGLTGWYQMLAKTPWDSPPSLFAPFSTFFFAMAGLGAWQVWQSSSPAKMVSTGIFLLELSLTAAWYWAFFSLHFLFAATVLIGVCGIGSGLLAILFFRANKLATVLFLPYFAWILYLSALSFSIWSLNQEGSGIQVITNPNE